MSVSEWIPKNLVRHVINKDLGCFDHETGRVDCATIPNSVNVFMCLTEVRLKHEINQSLQTR
jgi:hypothetical protein